MSGLYPERTGQKFPVGQEERIRHLETRLAELVDGASDTAVEASAAGLESAYGTPSPSGGGGGGPTILDGDVTGVTVDNTVEKIRNVTIPAPAAGDDEKFVKYQNGTPAYEYSHIDRIQNVPISAPVAGDDRKHITYVHGSVAFGYAHPSFKTRTETGNYTATLDDYVILVDATGGAVTVGLPTAASATQRGFHIKKIDSSVNAVTIDPNGAETVDDSASYSITAQYEAILVASDGTEWWIL